MRKFPPTLPAISKLSLRESSLSGSEYTIFWAHRGTAEKSKKRNNNILPRIIEPEFFFLKLQVACQRRNFIYSGCLYCRNYMRTDKKSQKLHRFPLSRLNEERGQ